MATWTDDELAAAVAAYRLMQQKQLRGEKVNKKQVYRDLSARFDRSPGAWEYRMQNISHVLHEMDQPWIPGLRPAANVGADVTERLTVLLAPHGAPALPTLTRGIFPTALRQATAAEMAVGAFSPLEAVDDRKRELRNIVRRQGQPAFRKALMDVYNGRCAISGCDVPDVLEAAHIYPYRGEHTNDPTNGLLLRADLHTLFDLYLIAVDPATMTIAISPSLLPTAYGRMDAQPLIQSMHPPFRPSAESLKWHRSQCVW